MTDATDTTDVTATTVDSTAVQHDDTTAPANAGGEERGRGNPEAAKYRTRLRETEAQRDALAARVETFQRADVHRLAAGHLSEPGDLFDVGGTTLAELLDEDGNVDEQLVTDAITALLQSRPGLGKPQPQKHSSGFGLGHRPAPVKPTGWAGLLNGS